MRIRRAGIDDGARPWALRVEMLADSPLAFIDTLGRVLARGLREHLDRVATASRPRPPLPSQPSAHSSWPSRVATSSAGSARPA